MTELTKEQLAMVEAAIDKCYPAGKQSKVKRRLIAELTPKPKFSEGQIVAWNDWPEDEPPDFQPLLMIYNHGTCPGYRSLNQAEVGPGWKPYKEWKELVDRYSELACKYSDLVDKKMTTSEVPGYKIAVEALERLMHYPYTTTNEGQGLRTIAVDALSRIKEMGGVGE